MKFWIICIVIALLIAPKAFAEDDAPKPDASPSSSETADEVEEREHDEKENIIALLSHYHEVPDREQLERGSENAKEIIFELARDEEVFLFHRQRALRALANWPTDEVYDYLVELLHDEATEDGLRHHLLPVLADGFGEDALEDLEPFLFEASDPQIRISAASAIASIPGDTSHDKLVEALRSETNPVVQSRIETFATRIR